MNSPLSRLAALGIELPPVATPLAAYVPAVRSGSLVFTSGQVPVVDGKVSATGKVGNYDQTPAGATAVFNFLTAQAKDIATYGTNPLWKTVDGPWKLSAYRPDGHSEFVPNPAYSGPVKPTLDKFVLEPFKMIACFAGAAFICWRLLLLSLLITPLAALIIHRLGTSIKRANRRALEEMSQIYTLLSESLSAISVVKAFTRERRG